MIEDIKEAIEKNLPAQVSKQLQEHLDKANYALEENKLLKERLDQSISKVKKLQHWESQAKTIELELKQLAEWRQQDQLDKRDHVIKVLENKYNDVRSLMHDVFRNKRLVYNESTRETIPMRDPQNGYVTHETKSKDIETIVEDD